MPNAMPAIAPVNRMGKIAAGASDRERQAGREDLAEHQDYDSQGTRGRPRPC